MSSTRINRILGGSSAEALDCTKEAEKKTPQRKVDHPTRW
jgi:hypothetical protein